MLQRKQDKNRQPASSASHPTDRTGEQEAEQVWNAYQNEISQEFDGPCPTAPSKEGFLRVVDAALTQARQEERERIAKLLETGGLQMQGDDSTTHILHKMMNDLAEVIRRPTPERRG